MQASLSTSRIAAAHHQEISTSDWAQGSFVLQSSHAMLPPLSCRHCLVLETCHQYFMLKDSVRRKGTRPISGLFSVRIRPLSRRFKAVESLDVAESLVDWYSVMFRRFLFAGFLAAPQGQTANDNTNWHRLSIFSNSTEYLTTGQNLSLGWSADQGESFDMDNIVFNGR